MSVTGKREHSPDYPAIGLREAVERLSRLYKNIQRHAAPRDLVAKGLGYNSLNGASMSAIAAIRKFGLLLKSGDTLRVSDRGTKILFPGSDAEREAELLEAALTPTLYDEIYRTFGWDLPNDDLVINYLMRKGFLIRSASVALAAFKDTAALVGGFRADYNSASELAREDEDENVLQSAVSIPAERALVPAGRLAPGATSPSNVERAATQITLRADERRLFDYEIETGGSVGVVVRGSVETDEALDIIATWIEVKRKELARRGKASAAGQSPPSPDPALSSDRSE